MPYFAIAALTVILCAIYFLRKNSATNQERSAAPESLRRTRYGEVIGFRDKNGLLSWQGIPYAAPPVGELRWKAPRPPTPWTGVRDALQAGNKPAQIGSASGGFPKEAYNRPAGSEDCLYMNIWSPEKSDKKLPVMVWIYGGGNSAGAADLSAYNIPYFAANGEVVVVTFNHRLGILGWFYHSALSAEAETPEDASGNFGTLDCVQALRWVQENIAEFGGDPDNVTVFGESAGGINTLSMVLVPQARGLFHRAIAQSAVTVHHTIDQAQNYADAPSPGHRHSSREMINLFLQKTGRANSAVEARALQDAMDADAIRDFLYSLSAEELLSPFNEVIMGMYATPSPIADGAVFPTCSWHEAFADPDKHNPVPLMVGANRDEFKLFMAGDTDDYVNMRFGRIPTPKDPVIYERDGRYLSEMWRAAAVDEVALSLVKHNTAPVFAYRFDWDDWPRLPLINLSVLIGAGHGLEVMFMFGLIAERPWLRFLLGRRRFREMTALGAAIRQYWISFATSAHPSSNGKQTLPQWTPWPADSGTLQANLMILDSPVHSACRMERNIVSVEHIKGRMLQDPRLKTSSDELCRLYARLFIYGVQGDYWDSIPYPGLEHYQPGGSKRKQAEACRPAQTR